MLFLMYATFMYKITRRQAFRDGPLNILGGGGGGWANTKKKFAHAENTGKNIVHNKPIEKKNRASCFLLPLFKSQIMYWRKYPLLLI